MTDDLTQRLLAHLHRGGAWAYLWSDRDRRSIWWPVGKALPTLRGDRNVYFGVHPSSSQRSARERACISDIAGINCLFADFDAKDFGGDKARVLAHVESLPAPTSLIIDSGGGYHCYWLLASTFEFTGQADRDRARRLQAAWVGFVGGDPGAKDLSRVLRLPGTLNYKYDPPRSVAIMQAGYNRLYDLSGFEKLLPPTRLRQRIASHEAGGNGHYSDDRAARYVQVAVTNELAELDGAREGRRNTQLFSYAIALGQLVGAGMLDGWEAENLLRSAALARGLDEHEVNATIKSGLDRGKREPRQIRDHPALLDGSAADAIAQASVTIVENALHQDPGRQATQAIAEKEYLTDLGNAKRLVRICGQDLHYVKAWGFLAWNGQRWERDETNAVYRMAKSVALSFYDDASAAEEQAKEAIRAAKSAEELGDREAVKAATKEVKECQKTADAYVSWAKSSQANARIEAMVRLTSSEPSVVRRAKDFESSAWLFNCANGTIDLCTGELHQHRREDHLTKVSPVTYDAKAGCPLWLSFLNKIMWGNSDMIRFLQKAVGYTLTGLTLEQCLFFLWGTGANGKSTFVRTVQEMLGDYARKTSTETLMVRRMEVISNDLAALAGARMVVAAEITEGRRLNESQVKDMTGDDIMTARFLYQEQFEFKPLFKLWMYGNHKPKITGTDDGIWRRVRLIPFTVKIADHEKDSRLGEKLHVELPGILAWAVQGCLAWQKDGLGVPEEVRMATAQYREESDALAAFLADCTIQQPGATAQAAKLYKAYQGWCSQNGEKELTGTMFGRQLTERGKEKRKVRNIAVYQDIGLVDAEESPRDD